MFNNKISTHINNAGHAVFEKKTRPVLTGCYNKQVVIDKAWITKTSSSICGLMEIIYLHRDVLVPFGAELTGETVEQSLKDCLGSRRTYYGKPRWHIYFQENTRQGTSNRIFITLEESASSVRNSIADIKLPIETSILALAAELEDKTRTLNFQFLIYWESFVFSVIYIAGSAFHLLRLENQNNGQAIDRIKKQASYASSQLKENSKLTAYIVTRNFSGLYHAMANSGCWKEIIDAEVYFNAAEKNHNSLIHYGLALAATDPELSRHDRTVPSCKAGNSDFRDIRSLVKVSAAALIICMAILIYFGFDFYTASRKLTQVKNEAAAFYPIIKSMENSQDSLTKLTSSLKILRPLWYVPLSWARVFNAISSSLPDNAGIDGFLVEHPSGDSYNLKFKAWVRDWDKISTLKINLESFSFITNVKLSEQKKNLQRGVVDFHVDCEVLKN